MSAPFVNADPLAEWLDLIYGNPLNVIADCIRSFICAPPGKDLMASDFANIEGRGLAWLSGEEWKLQAFRDFDAGKGPDLYLVSAARIYETDVSAYTKASPERQHGKVAELALGYAGGVKALEDMAETYLITIPEHLKQPIVDKWREVHPATKQYWRDLENAAIRATAEPGVMFQAGALGREVRFKKSGSFLFCRLPSGNVIIYPYPFLREVGFYKVKGERGIFKCSVRELKALEKQGFETWTKNELNFWSTDPTTKAWTQQSTYGGSLAENVTQAFCRDLLAWAMLREEAAGYPITFHIHDELVTEVPEGFGSLREFESIMAQVPPWAAGLPIVAKGWRDKRYRKG